MTNLINTFGPLLWGTQPPEPRDLTGRPTDDQAASAVTALGAGQSISGMLPFTGSAAVGTLSLVADSTLAVVVANAGTVSLAQPLPTLPLALSYQLTAPAGLPVGHYRAKIVIAGTTLFSNRILYKPEPFPVFAWKSDYNLNGVPFNELPALRLSSPLQATIGANQSEDEFTVYGEITTGIQQTVSTRQAAFVQVRVRVDALGIQLVRSMLQHKVIFVNGQPHAPKSGLQLDETTVIRGMATGSFELWNNDVPTLNRTIL